MTDEDEREPGEDEPPPPPSVDPERPRRIRNRQKRKLAEAQEFWRSVLASEIGRREVWGLLNELHPLECRFQCGPNGFPQPEATWSALGEQLAGQRILQTLRGLDPDGVRTMLEEHDPAPKAFG